MHDDAWRFLTAKVYSVADWTRDGCARSIGEALEILGDAAPDRWGRSEPARRCVKSSLAEFLLEWSPRFATPDSALFLDGERAQMWIESCPATSGGTVRDFLRDRCCNKIELTVDQDWFASKPDRLECLFAVFCGLCDSADAFYGCMTPTDLLQQGFNLHGASYEVGLIELPDFHADPKYRYPPKSYYVEDVGWLNYFGPAFVDRWGRPAIERVGVCRRWLSNGGVVVWATEHLPEYEPVDRISGYSWKQSFYEHLDPDAFVHEGFKLGEPGERVPLFEEHRRWLRPKDASS